MKIYKTLGLGLLVALMASATPAQRPRMTSNPEKPDASRPTPQPAPQTVKAKYEGGIFGYNKKLDGTLSFDDTNDRLIFRDKKQKEVLSIPYHSVQQAFADTQSKRPAAATVVGSLPLPYGANIPAWFVRKKYQYLTLQVFDPDSQASGVTSFKMADKETVASILAALADKAELTQRGEVFVRRKTSTDSSTVKVPVDRSSDPASSKTVIHAGVLNGKAVRLPQPDYPKDAREAGVTGEVSVEITIDEKGEVIEAHAVSGDPLLQAAAVAAARQAKFTPTTLEGQPVKVSGVITYSFVL